MTSFYVYQHTRNDTGQVFYVGKGKDRRAWSHKNRNPHWRRIVAKHGYEIAITKSGLCESDAFSEEKRLIAELRDKGVVLTNLTDGGDGPSGFVFSEEQNKKNSDSRKAFFATEVGKQHIEKMNRARLSDPEVMKLAIERRSATMRTSEYRSKRRAIAQEIANRPGVKERLKASSKAYHSTPEARALNSARAIKHFESQEARDKSASSHGTKPFVCLQTGAIYRNMSAAAKEFGINVGHLHQVLSGKGKSAKGLTFKYINNVLETQAIDG